MPIKVGPWSRTIDPVRAWPTWPSNLNEIHSHLDSTRPSAYCMPDSSPTCLLSELPSGAHAVVARLQVGAGLQHTQTVRRLSELGFIAGEPVQLLRRGPGGREPLAVQVGDTLFALRLFEAGCIEVTPGKAA